MASPAYWDQTRFNAALKAQIGELSGGKLADAINKKGFFLALRAASVTRKKDPFEIAMQTSKQVTATRKDGTAESVQLLWVLAAKRVAKTWQEKKMTRGEGRKRAVGALSLYRRLLKKKAATILGSRQRASGYLKIGWVSVMKAIKPFVRGVRIPDASSTGAKLKGRLKGEAVAAAKGQVPQVKLESWSQTKTDKRNGLLRIGGPALQRAFDAETADILEHISKETKDSFDRTNKALA